MEWNTTQCFALAHLHKSMKDFLYDYAEGTLNREFFIKGMAGMIDNIDNLVRENGNYNCSDGRGLIIKKEG